MTKKFLFIILLLFTTNCYSAELLVKARAHWMDSWSAAKVASLTEQELASYNSRSQIGDIIVVRPDGWEWGKEERLPNYIVVQLPNISINTVKHYEQTLTKLVDINDPSKGSIMLKRRKHRVPPAFVNSLISQNKSIVKIAVGQINNFKATIIEKTQ